MNFKSLSLLTLLTCGSVFPQAGLITTVQPVNKQNVITAQEAYAAKAQWVPYVHYATMGLSAAALAYIVYKSYLSNMPSEITTEKANNLINATEALHKKYDEALLELAKNKATITVTTTTGKTTSDILYDAFAKTASVTGSGVQWVGSTLASGAGWAGTLIATSFNAAAYGNLFSYFIAPYFALSGSLAWYIQKHTEWNAHSHEFQNALELYESYKNDLPAIAQLLVSDIEKMLGYMAHFEAQIKEQSGIVKAAYARHVLNFRGRLKRPPFS